eukprot:scaffold73_cov337-Pavlova_lutheri.AAC.51
MAGAPGPSDVARALDGRCQYWRTASTTPGDVEGDETDAWRWIRWRYSTNRPSRRPRHPHRYVATSSANTCGVRTRHP